MGVQSEQCVLRGESLHREGSGDRPEWYRNRAFTIQLQYLRRQLRRPYKKDKMFFFGDYQGGRTSQSSALLDDGTDIGIRIRKSDSCFRLEALLRSPLILSRMESAEAHLTSPLMVPTTEGGDDSGAAEHGV